MKLSAMMFLTSHSNFYVEISFATYTWFRNFKKAFWGGYEFGSKEKIEIWSGCWFNYSTMLNSLCLMSLKNSLISFSFTALFGFTNKGSPFSITLGYLISFFSITFFCFSFGPDYIVFVFPWDCLVIIVWKCSWHFFYHLRGGPSWTLIMTCFLVMGNG